MAKKAQASTEQIYKYPIEDVFRVISESIIKQMQGPGKKNNLNLVNPLGKESDYLIKQGSRELPVHFEVTAFEKPKRFSYLMVYNNVRTETEWILEDYDAQTTNVTYIERAGNSSIFNKLLLLLNKKKFHRTANGYFYQIDVVLEKEAKEKGSKKKDKTATTNDASNKETATKKATTKKTTTKKTATKKTTDTKATTKKATTKKTTSKKTTSKKTTSTKANDYESMTVAQLRELAQKQNIKVTTRTKKAEIIALLKK